MTCLRNGCAVGKPHLHVSDIEAFRYYKDSDDDTLEDILRRLRHEEPPSDRMLAGAAFAKLMERGGPFPGIETADVDGWHFVFALDATIEEPDGHEVEGELVVETPDGPITLVGHADSITAQSVRDDKLTERFDAERYVDSLQWKAYLPMFSRKRFDYTVWECSYRERTVTIKELHRLTFYAYPDMRKDVARAVTELAGIVVAHMPETAAAT